MAFPTSLTNAQDGVTDVLAAHINAVEAKIGIDSSAVTTSHDYKLSEVTSTDKAVGKTATQTLSSKTLTSPVLNGDITGTGVLDEDTMATNSSTKLATQQSIKAYVDSKVNTDGWKLSADTWTYASASTFTIAGVDRTATYTKGTRLKFTNSTVKYATVASSSFSTDTTVTIVVNTDYALANAAISSAYYSYELSPQGYPTWFNITPTTSNISGFSSIAGYIYKYKIEGASCTIWLHIQGTSNSASFAVTVPLTSITSSTTMDSPAIVLDNGTWQAAVGALGVVSNTTTFPIGKTIGSIAGGTYAGFTTSGTKGVNCSFTYQY